MNFSPSIRIIIDCRLIQKSLKQNLYKIKPCRSCNQYTFTPETGPMCLGINLLSRMVYDITRNIFVNPNCHHIFNQR